MIKFHYKDNKYKCHLLASNIMKPIEEEKYWLAYPECSLSLSLSLSLMIITIDFKKHSPLVYIFYWLYVLLSMFDAVTVADNMNL